MDNKKIIINAASISVGVLVGVFGYGAIYDLGFRDAVYTSERLLQSNEYCKMKQDIKDSI